MLGGVHNGFFFTFFKVYTSVVYRIDRFSIVGDSTATDGFHDDVISTELDVFEVNFFRSISIQIIDN